MSVTSLGSVSQSAEYKDAQELKAEEFNLEAHKGKHQFYDWALENGAKVSILKKGDNTKYAYELNGDTLVHDRGNWRAANPQELEAIGNIGKDSTEKAQAETKNNDVFGQNETRETKKEPSTTKQVRHQAWEQEGALTTDSTKPTESTEDSPAKISAKEFNTQAYKGEDAFYNWAKNKEAKVFKLEQGAKTRHAYQRGGETLVETLPHERQQENEIWRTATAEELSAIKKAKQEGIASTDLLTADSMQAFNIFNNKNELPETIQKDLTDGKSLEVFKSTARDGRSVYSVKYAEQEKAKAYIGDQEAELSDNDQKTFEAASKKFIEETFKPMWSEQFSKVQSSAQGGHSTDEIQIPSNIQELNIRVASHKTSDSSGYKLGNYQWQRGTGIKGHFHHGNISENGAMTLGSRRSYSFDRIKLINGREFDYRDQGYGHPFISVAQRTNQ